MQHEPCPHCAHSRYPPSGFLFLDLWATDFHKTDGNFRKPKKPLSHSFHLLEIKTKLMQNVKEITRHSEIFRGTWLTESQMSSSAFLSLASSLTWPLCASPSPAFCQCWCAHSHPVSWISLKTAPGKRRLPFSYMSLSGSSAGWGQRWLFWQQCSSIPDWV